MPYQMAFFDPSIPDLRRRENDTEWYRVETCQGQTMRLPPRRITSLDVMIMVAAVAAWIVLTELWVRELATELPTYVRDRKAHV